MNPLAIWHGMERGDRAMFAGMLASIIVWWIYNGKHKYSAKGMR